MRWPWQQQKTEVRNAQPFTDAIVAALASGVSGNAASPAASAALEAAAGHISRGFAVATVEGAPDMVRDALTADVLSLIARNLIRRGESLFLIEINNAGLALRPAGSWDVRGGWDPSDWWYRLDLFGPSGNVTRFVPSASVVHLRYATDPARIWRGVSPMGFAAETGALHAGVQNALRSDMRAVPATVIPMPQQREQPDDADDDPLGPIKRALLGAGGKSVFVETTTGAHGQDAAPRLDWQQKRLGANPPETLAALLSQTSNMVMAAAGVDPIIAGLSRGDGTLAREAYRRFERLTLQPLARLIQTELRSKLDSPDLTISFNSLRSSDFAGLARAYKALKDSGMSPAEINELLDLGGRNVVEA